MGGRRGTARTCDECGRSWGRRATWCGACGDRLVEVAPGREDRGARGRRPWPSPLRLLGGLAAVVVVVGAAVAVPTITIERSQAVDGDVALPTEDAGMADGPPPVPTMPPPDAPEDPPSVDCERDGRTVDCVAWTADVNGPGGPEVNGPFGPVGQFGRTALALSGHRLTAVDATTGRPQWHRDAEGPIDGVRLESGMVGLDADRRFQLLALTTGEPEWSVETDGEVVGELLYGGLVYTAAPGEESASDGDAPPALAARRVEDGVLQWLWHPPASWHEDVDAPAGSGRPPLVLEQFDDRHVLVGAWGQGLAVLDARTGEVQWQREDVQRLAADARGVTVRDVIEEEHGARPGPRDGAPPVVVSRLDATTGEVSWRREFPLDEGNGWPAVRDDLVLVPTTDGLQALDLATGERRWETEGREQPRVPFEVFGSSRDRESLPVVVTLEETTGWLRARDPHTGEVRWQMGTPPQGVHVMLVGDRVLVGTDRGLEYVDVVTGTVLLRVRGSRNLFPTREDPGLLFDLRSRHMIRLDPELLAAR